MGSPHDDGARTRQVRVALVGCSGLLGEIIIRTLGDQPGFDVVATLEPSSLSRANFEADIVVWNDADESVVAAWLREAHASPRVLATLCDGRNASLWQLTPQRTELGALSPAVLVDTIRTGGPPPSPGRGSDR